MSSLVGTWSLVRFALKRDRLGLAVWVLVLGILPVGTASAFAGLYTTEAARIELAATVASNPAMVAMLGPVHASNIGALTAWRIGTIGSLLVGLMAVLTMIRHTRDEEETGRRELLGSTVVGRHAPLSAALVVTAAAGLAIGLIIGGGLVGMGLPAGGAFAYGLGFAGVAASFAAVGGVAAQLTESAAAARGIGVATAGFAFLLRMVGDGGGDNGSSWLSWLSPIGWFGKLRPFADEQWWVISLWLALALFLSIVAFRLAALRDVGSGVFTPRPGPAAAGPRLVNAGGLAWRLQRGSLIGWTIGLMAIGGVYGSIGDSIGDMLDDNPQLAEIFELIGGEQGITDAFFSAAVGILAIIASAYAIRAVLRLRVEEEEMRAEPILATSTPRVRWATSHLVFGLIGPALMLAMGAAVAGATYGVIVGDVAGHLPRVMGSAMIQLPAVWVLTGVAMALFGLAPRFASVSWGVLVTFLLLGQLGQILQFPQWSLNLSPFSHIPLISAEPLTVTPLLALVVIAFALLGAGLTGFQRRDAGSG
jgi:ABC-2 type transport system permease protein